MTAVYSDPWLTIHGGDCRAVMASMEPESVHCVVTSPPYWGLRDYGTPGQLGLEPTPEAYVESMVAVFREVRRVLRADGTVWLNLGDSYFGTGKGPTHPTGLHSGGNGSNYPVSGVYRHPSLKEKDLVGIPWRVAFALQADGWYLRSDIIWAKPNPMPESVTDRPTKAHEYVFLLSKSPRYYFDADAVREPNEHPNRTGTNPRLAVAHAGVMPHGSAVRGGIDSNPSGRNIRTVWTIATQPYPGAHFAVFPEKLVEPCVLAGCPPKACAECGAPWERIMSQRDYPAELANASKAHGGIGNNLGGQRHQDWLAEHPKETLGWRPTCAHDTDTVAGTVLDPFGGSGTTARVANRLGRRAVLIDLNPEYLQQQVKRAVEGVGLPLGLDVA